MSDGKTCELCGREVELLTRHHLIPRTRHKNKRNKREFDRADVKHRIAMFCRPCHDHVHALFTEKQLERELNTVDLLKTHSEIARFIGWIQGKPGGYRPSSQDSTTRKSC